MRSSIGDSRVPDLTVKTLRYHDVGLLAADVDAATGYRRYTTGQIPAAQVIRRFRELGMPLEEIRTVMDAPDVGHPQPAHRRAPEPAGGRSWAARSAPSPRCATCWPRRAPRPSPDIALREAPAMRAAAITETVDMADGAAWMQGALGELYATVAGQGLAQTGPAGGLFTEPVFTDHHGEVTVFVPCDGAVRPLGRVRPAGCRRPSSR